MAIFLKDQIKPAKLLLEAPYLPYNIPKFDTKYYVKNYDAHETARKTGRMLFYDFYAMEFLWSFLGSGQLPKIDRLKGLTPEEGENPVIRNKAHRFLPAANVKVIDNVYEQVLHQVSSRLIGYLRAAVHQEFRYIHSDTDWTRFYNGLLTQYNSKNTLTEDDINRMVEKHIPKLKPYPDTVRRLIKFSTVYKRNLGHTTLPNDYETGNIDPASELPLADEPLANVADDDTDYGAEPVEVPGGGADPETLAASPYTTKWWDKQEVPPNQSSFLEPAIVPDPDEPDDEVPPVTLEPKKPLTESSINIGVLKPVYRAAVAARLQLKDLELAYKLTGWSVGYGGARWGEAVTALIKLLKSRDNNDLDGMNQAIDHIYDLQHNSGSLLNKGPMYVTNDDLNRRFKITDVTRFIPFVSSLVKTMILRYQPYLRASKEIADREANMEKYLASPKLPLTSTEEDVLEKMGMRLNDSGDYYIKIHFLNKAKNQVGGVYYQLTKHNIGTSENPDGKYIVQDNYRSDVKMFESFDQAVAYLNNYKSDFRPDSTYGHTKATLPTPKDKYFSSNYKVALTLAQEQELLDLNVGLNNVTLSYTAYLKDGRLFELFAFSNGTYMTTYSGEKDFDIHNSWSDALEAAKIKTVNSYAHPNKDALQAKLDASLYGKVSVGHGGSGIPAYTLTDAEISDLEKIVKTQLPHDPENDYSLKKNQATGMMALMKKFYHSEKPIFSVGKPSAAAAKTYFLKFANGQQKTFPNWSDVYNYLSKNINIITGEKVPTATVTQTTYSSELPPNAASTAAYNVHAGISTIPNSIRLTVQDEARLEAIGFKPYSNGDNVVYLHDGTKDSVRFFPNNTSKIVFAKFKLTSVNNTIEKNLAWLEANYKSGQTESPIKTGGKAAGLPAISPSTQPSTPSDSIKAGTMFQTDISNAGFSWNDSEGKYVAGNGDTLKIFPSRASIMIITDPNNPTEKKGLKFINMVSLISYLKNTYKPHSPAGV